MPNYVWLARTKLVPEEVAGQVRKALAAARVGPVALRAVGQEQPFADRAATALRLAFEARYDPASATLSDSIRSGSQPLAAPLQIYLAHPTQPGKDLRLLAVPDAFGRFSLALPMLERAHWQVVVEGPRREWRLARSWSWPRRQGVEIVADAPEAR